MYDEIPLTLHACLKPSRSIAYYIKKFATKFL